MKNTVNLTIDERINRCHQIRKELVDVVTIRTHTEKHEPVDKEYLQMIKDEQAMLIAELVQHHKVLGVEEEITNLKTI